MASNITNWYEYPSNFSGGNNVQGLADYFNYSNYVMGGDIGGLIVVTTFLVTFLLLKGFGAERGFTTSMFITFMVSLSLFLSGNGLITIIYVITTAILTVVGAMVLRNSNNRGL